MDLFWPIVTLVLLMVVLSTIKLVPDGERFAVFILGRFARFKGPGLVLKIPSTGSEWKLVKAGERGTIISNEVGQFAAGHLPMLLDGRAIPGASIRVTGFEPDRLHAAVDSDQTKTVICAKCGHENRLV